MHTTDRATKQSVEDPEVNTYILRKKRTKGTRGEETPGKIKKIPE